MKQIGISKQIILAAILPALVVATILSVYYIWNQFDYITETTNNNGRLIAKQLSPAAEYAIYSGNIDLLKPLTDSVMQNNSVLRIQILDKYNNKILNIARDTVAKEVAPTLLEKLLDSERQIDFREPIYSPKITIADDERNNTSGQDEGTLIGRVIVTISTHEETLKKSQQIENGSMITIVILLLTSLVALRISSAITRPIKSLTRTVRNITTGDFSTPIDKNATGEIGVLQSCINHMANELEHSQSDMENQLSEYTYELQQTLEELEIRNAELDITRSKAIYASNAKSEFLANMSHEIRTPLSGIIGFTELLQSTSLTGQQKDYSSTIQKSAKTLLEIINDILDLSKIESGKTEITTSKFDLVNIIEDIINLLSPNALEKNIELFYRIEQGIPTHIHSDSFRIHQILTNLISNAIKFTENGYVYLQVTQGEISDVENSLKFSVSDTGIGLSSTDKSKLFKAFTQADTSITRRFGGTGLGLVISRKLTMLMNGEIGFDSTEGEGSTFWFSIPVDFVDNEKPNTELNDKRIALFCNHFIARQSFKTLFSNAQCFVTDYNLRDLKKVNDIESYNDAIVVFLSKKEINNNDDIDSIYKQALTKPSLLIASTHSHDKLRNLQQHTFDSAVFTSEKTERIKQKLLTAINRNMPDTAADDLDEENTSAADWSKMNIMVVDDNEINLRLAEIILHKHKARVTTARSGTQAIEHASLNSFDLIFMDLHMPGLDGYATTKKIRSTTPGKQPVIIALTANALPQEKEKVLNSTMNGILIKPVSDILLQKVINQWVLKESFDNTSFGSFNNDNTIHYDLKNNDIMPDSDAVFSIEQAKEFTGNNTELAYELFEMLRAELDSYRSAITAAFEENNLDKLLEQVHKLHGASRCCGTTALKNASGHLENLINQNMNFDVKKERDSILNAIENVAEFKIDTI